MAMEKFQRGHPAPERTRNRSGTMTGDKAIAKKRSSLGKAAGGFQSRFLASLRSKKKNDADEELAPNLSRYVLYPLDPWDATDHRNTAHFWMHYFDYRRSSTSTCCASYVSRICSL